MSKPKELPMPPDHLINKWYSEYSSINSHILIRELNRHLCYKAAQWGADKELGACCDWLEDVVCDDPQDTAKALRAHRRPKPPSLKQQALEALETADIGYSQTLTPAEASIVRRALEALPDD